MSIKIDLKIFLFILLFCFTSQIEMYILLMLFAMIHEIGHLCAGLIMKFKLQEMSITPYGMKIEFKPQCEEYNIKVMQGNCLTIKRAIVAMAGPLTNFLIICITMFAMKLNEEILVSEIAKTTIYANLLIAIFNLLPMYPLDGGRTLKEILHIKFGLQKSYVYTYNISKVSIIILTIISSILIMYVQNISILIILIYLWGIMLVERKRYYEKQRINKIILSEGVIKQEEIRKEETSNN